MNTKIAKKVNLINHSCLSTRHSYVGFWARTWASFIDTVLVVAFTYPLLIGIYGWAYLDSHALMEGPLDFLISWVLPALAIVGFWMARSATPGKMVISACIVDARSGLKPSWGQLVRRYLGYLVSTVPLCLGFLWVAFDSKKQGWHDKIAGTVVVYRQKNHRQSMKIGNAFEKNDLEYRERHRLDPEDSKSKVEPELVPF